MNLIIFKRKLVFAAALLGMLLVYCEPGFALSCRAGTDPKGSVNQQFPIGLVYLAHSDFQKGTLLWRSETYTATFTCRDTNGHPEGEDAYIYWDPQGDLARVDRSLSVGVTINGHDYDDIHDYSKSRGPDVGKGTTANGSGTATSETINVSFSLYIKATGAEPPASFPNISGTKLFQIDGEGGLNNVPNSNYNAELINFNNINVLECTPEVKILGTSANTIDFGTIMKETAASGKVAKVVPFSVTADVAGGGCKGRQLAISFSSNDADATDSTRLIPQGNPGVGISITPKDSATPITFGSVYNFTDDVLSGEATSVSKDYLAGLRWLTDNPSVGVFSATAIVSITFK